MNKITNQSLKIILFSLCIILFVYLTKLLLLNEIKLFDDMVFNLVANLRCEPLTIIFKFFSFLCSFYFVIILTIIIMLFSKDKKVTFYIVLNVLFCFFLNQTLKFFFARSRPTEINLIVENGYSFPSGHSMLSLAYYGFFVYLILNSNIKRKNKILAIISLALLIFFIGLSRIYLGVHYASDVLAGFAISAAYLILYIQFFYNKKTIK